MEPRTSVSVLKMLGAYKKHPQAYFLYVEDCFLLSDNADVPSISKGLVGFIMRQYNREQFYILCFCRFDNALFRN